MTIQLCSSNEGRASGAERNEKRLIESNRQYRQLWSIGGMFNPRGLLNYTYASYVKKMMIIASFKL